MVLDDYFDMHREMAYLRVALVASFSALLTVSIAIVFMGYLYMLAYHITRSLPDENMETKATGRDHRVRNNVGHDVISLLDVYLTADVRRTRMAPTVVVREDFRSTMPPATTSTIMAMDNKEAVA